MNCVIGTRTWLGAGWLHVDGDPSPLTGPDGSQHPVDLVCDARSIPLPDGGFPLVYSSECLEHFPWAQGCKVLTEWARLVAPGGLLKIEVPDFLAACAEILSIDSEAGDFAMQQIVFGGQANKLDAHYAGLTPRMLTRWMTNAGLSVVSVERGFECGWLRVVGQRG